MPCTCLKRKDPRRDLLQIGLNAFSFQGIKARGVSKAERVHRFIGFHEDDDRCYII